MENEYMITTIDNPFDPFEQFISWFLFDIEKGYYTCAKLARLVTIADDMSQKEIEVAMDNAIDRLIEIDPLNIYIRINRKQTIKEEVST